MDIWDNLLELSILVCPLICTLLVGAAFFTKWNKQSKFANTIFGFALLPSLHVLFFAVAFAFYTIGGCEGAMDSGVSCIRGNGFGELSIYAELSILLVGWITLPLSWIATALLFTHVLADVGLHIRSLNKD